MVHDPDNGGRGDAVSQSHIKVQQTGLQLPLKQLEWSIVAAAALTTEYFATIQQVAESIVGGGDQLGI